MQVPGDAEIVLGTLAKERPPAAQLPPSCFADDVAAIQGCTAAEAGGGRKDPRKGLSGSGPSSPICALDTPFGSSRSDACSSLSQQVPILQGLGFWVRKPQSQLKSPPA